MTICFASNNPHKLAEIKRALGSEEIVILSLQEINCLEELPETRDTLEGNALQKAQYVFDNYHTPCFADDTGLEVDALSRAPGVYSARYAGEQRKSEDNINLLLTNLGQMSTREAQFRTVIALVGMEKDPIFFEGVVRGTIDRKRRGTSGFGYDPVFIPAGYTRSFAEMTLDEKNSLSHRGIAVKKLRRYLTGYASGS